MGKSRIVLEASSESFAEEVLKDAKYHAEAIGPRTLVATLSKQQFAMLKTSPGLRRAILPGGEVVTGPAFPTSQRQAWSPGQDIPLGAHQSDFPSAK
jgi:hypothetical protein